MSFRHLFPHPPLPRTPVSIRPLSDFFEWFDHTTIDTYLSPLSTNTCLPLHILHTLHTLHTLQTTYLAAFKGHIESVRALLDLGANVNAQTKAGATPLHLAARSGNATTVALLVASGADVDAYVIVDCVCVLYCVLYCVFYCCR